VVDDGIAMLGAQGEFERVGEGAWGWKAKGEA
jgi:hypothetical protein